MRQMNKQLYAPTPGLALSRPVCLWLVLPLLYPFTLISEDVDIKVELSVCEWDYEYSF